MRDTACLQYVGQENQPLVAGSEGGSLVQSQVLSTRTRSHAGERTSVIGSGT